MMDDLTIGCIVGLYFGFSISGIIALVVALLRLIKKEH